MQIYVVQSGDTVTSVARRYGVSPTLLGDMNQIPDGRLTVGQTLVVYENAQVHVVRQGETLSGIAAAADTTVEALYRNNYFLGGTDALQPGEKLILSTGDEKRGTLGVNGYAYPFISRQLLREELPYMTYMTPFTYGMTRQGLLIEPEDEALLSAAQAYGVQPWLHLSTWTGERFDSALGGAILEDAAAQEALFAALTQAVTEKGFGGVDVDFEYLPRDKAAAYAAFIGRLRARMNAMGIPVIVALAPKTSAAQQGLLYEAHDYAALGAAANGVLLMTYEWGYTAGPPMAVAPLPQVRQVLDYALTEIPAQKIFLGLPTYGYDWPLPFVPGETRANSLSPTEAVSLALQYGAEIQYDLQAQAPWFRYTDAGGTVHEVWFEDARSALAKLSLAAEKGLQGVGIWSLMRRAPQTYLVLNGGFSIESV